MDINDFADSFFEEAEELLDDMERHLLALDLDEPDSEQLNAIFRAAHSIKGGAGAFGFSILQQTTHILENLLDYARRGELTLRRDIIDIFLEAKDRLHDQLAAYRHGEEPDGATFKDICEVLERLAADEVGSDTTPPAAPVDPTREPAPVERHSEPSGEDTDPLTRICRVLQQLAREAKGEGTLAVAAEPGGNESPQSDPHHLVVALLDVPEKDRLLLIEELALLGDVVSSGGDEKRFEVTCATTASADDIEAVLCFVVEPTQLEIRSTTTPPAAHSSADAAQVAPVAAAPDKPSRAAKKEAKPAKATTSETSSIRVPVDKVDHIINLVGELIITQSMINQTVAELGVTAGHSLTTGVGLLQRNARDLQEAVMSIRMVQMDYVFSRFPRLVRDLAGKLDKEVELICEGKSTELDKGLIERIIDPLTHLVRNSLDHGIELPGVRAAAGKPRCGQLMLSARHQGGNIIIEVSDDGAGLNREKLLAKARSNGLDVSDAMSDDEVWQLIFAPGFSTAEVVSDVSGRGVGMDVVRRNIQAMGGHVEIASRPGAGTTTRIVLPLTLAILDGMSVRVGEEMFILPLGVVSELLQPDAANLFTMAGDDTLFKVRDDYLPVVSLAEVMDVPNGRADPCDCIAVIVEGESRRYALLIDEPVGQQQVVVKNIETNYRKVPGVSGATILGDGRVALILDVAELHRFNHARKKHLSAVSRQPQF